MRHPKLQDFIRLFNSQAFFEAHEVLEELWLETEGDQKTFYKGLIQCAVAMANWKKNNRKGAHQVGQRSLSILQNFESIRNGVHVAQLISDCELFLEEGLTDFPQIMTTSD